MNFHSQCVRIIIGLTALHAMRECSIRRRCCEIYLPFVPSCKFMQGFHPQVRNRCLYFSFITSDHCNRRMIMNRLNIL